MWNQIVLKRNSAEANSNIGTQVAHETYSALLRPHGKGYFFPLNLYGPVGFAFGPCPTC